jgi:hypothetical protein
VIVRVPHHWALRKEGEQAVIDEVERTLRNSQRVNLILLSWEVWSRAQDRMVYLLMFRPFLNHAPAVAVPGLEALVRNTLVGSGE